MKTIALIIFIATYVLMLTLPKWRAHVALIMAAAMVVIGALPVNEVITSIDWNVIMMILGTMGIVSLFIESKMPALMADWIINRTPKVKLAIIALSLFAGLISAFVDNVATVLMVVPIALAISKKLNISPVPAVISISVSSNLQGAATLVGDTTSILLGGYANMTFFDFFIFRGKPSLFWIVQMSAVVSAIVLYWIFRKEEKAIEHQDLEKIESIFPTVLLVGTVALLVYASFIPEKPAFTQGYICMGVMAVGIIWDILRKRSLSGLQRIVKEEIDYTTLLLLCGLFVIIAGITQVGIIEDISKLFIKVGGNNIFVLYSVLVWVSVVASAFIDNIPYVATMLPVVSAIAANMGVDPYILYFGLLSGATLGGNFTPIGASANITSLGILRREGYEVSTKDFMRISVPFTLSAVITGYILVWVIFG